MTSAINIIIAIIFMTLGSITFYACEHVKTLDNDIKIYQGQIANLQAQSIEQAKNYEAARQKANIQMRQVQDEAKTILATKIPKGCMEAISWGVNEAQNFV